MRKADYRRIAIDGVAVGASLDKLFAGGISELDQKSGQSIAFAVYAVAIDKG